MINFKPTSRGVNLRGVNLHYPLDWYGTATRFGRLLHHSVKRARRCARRSARLMHAIVWRGAIEPLMVFIIANLIGSGLTLLAAHATPVLGYPKFFGFAYLALATIGTLGLLGREPRVKAVFGFIGLFLRLWMSARFLLTDWQSPQWVMFAVGAAAFGWIGARSACRYVWVKAKAQQLKSFA